MTLYIDTTDFSKVTYALSSSPPFKGGARGGYIIKKQTYKIDPHQSNQILSKLDSFLGKSKVTKIIVNKGPGSYTGVRIGVTHALALGFAWNVPVKAVANDKFKIQ